MQERGIQDSGDKSLPVFLVLFTNFETISHELSILKIMNDFFFVSNVFRKLLNSLDHLKYLSPNALFTCLYAHVNKYMYNYW